MAADDPVVLAEADLVILAAPVQQNLECCASCPRTSQARAVVTDTGSTKREMWRPPRRCPSRLTFIGGHPLGGAARGGIEHARPDLFSRAAVALYSRRRARPGGLEKLNAFAAGLGAVPQTLSAGRHDRLLAFISHLPQLTVSALMHVVGDAAGREGLALSGRGLQDTTRLASSPADIWKEVCATNADEIGDGARRADRRAAGICAGI